MYTISIKKYFFFISLLLMITTYLPIVYLNMPPLIRSHHFWTTIWLGSLLIIHPNIFFNQQIKYTLVFGLILYIATNTLWRSMDNHTATGLFKTFYEILVGISIITYYNYSKDYIGLAKITKWALIFMFITSIMTIITSNLDPMYARKITGMSVLSGEEKDLMLSYKRLGGGTYSTATAFMCLFPPLIYYFKNKIDKIYKIYIICFLAILFFALIRMQIFTNIIFAVALIVISFLGIKRIKSTVISFILLVAIYSAIPKEFYSQTLKNISSNFDKESNINYKLNDLAEFAEDDNEIENKKVKTGTELRADRYPLLWESFIKSPFLGIYFLSDKQNPPNLGGGAHLAWMYFLTTFGLIGFILFIAIFYFYFKNQIFHISTDYKLYFYAASFSILAYGIFKALGGRETWYAFFVIIPGMYYLPLLNKKEENSNDSL